MNVIDQLLLELCRRELIKRYIAEGSTPEEAKARVAALIKECRDGK